MGHCTEALLLLVEDHPLFRDGFCRMIEAMVPDWTVRTVDCADAARAFLARYTPKLVLVDAGLPDFDGFALLDEIRARHPGILTMLISAREDRGAQMRARGCGARGFLGKRESSETMVSSIRTVIAGGVAFDTDSGGVPTLSERQRQILALLAQGHGNKEIRFRLSIAERTVRAHLTDLFQALGVQGRLQAILRARELGLIE